MKNKKQHIHVNKGYKFPSSVGERRQITGFRCFPFHDMEIYKTVKIRSLIFKRKITIYILKCKKCGFMYQNKFLGWDNEK